MSMDRVVSYVSGFGLLGPDDLGLLLRGSGGS